MGYLRGIYYKIILIFKLPAFYFRGNKIIKLSNRISSGVFLSGCKIGNYNYIGKNAIIRLTHISNYCSIAAGVQIGGMEHPYWYGSTSPVLFPKGLELNNNITVIEDDVWIGANAIIKRGVTIGRGAVIGSSSLVLSDVPEYSIVVGIPAKVIKSRFEPEIIDSLRVTKFWEKPPYKAKQLLKHIEFKKK